LWRIALGRKTAEELGLRLSLWRQTRWRKTDNLNNLNKWNFGTAQARARGWAKNPIARLSCSFLFTDTNDHIARKRWIKILSELSADSRLRCRRNNIITAYEEGTF